MNERKTIITDRLLLRPASEDRDLREYLVHLNDAEDCILLYGEPFSKELEREIYDNADNEMTYSVFLRDTQTMIGSAGFLFEDEEYSEWFVNFWIFREYRQNGYAKEAMSALLDSYFAGTLFPDAEDRIWAQTLDGNKSSERLLHSLGFHEIYSATAFLYHDGKEVMLEIENYVLGASEYRTVLPK